MELLGATPRPRVPRERDRLHFTLQGSRGVTVHGAADELLYTDENGCVCAKDQVFKCDIYIRENHGYASVPDWSEGARCGIVTTVHSLRCACGRRGTVISVLCVWTAVGSHSSFCLRLACWLCGSGVNPAASNLVEDATCLRGEELKCTRLEPSRRVRSPCVSVAGQSLMQPLAMEHRAHLDSR